MPSHEFLGIHARKLELTAELYAHEAHRRYSYAHEERRNFYVAYRNVSHEEHSRFCQILAYHFAKARRAEAKSHFASTQLQVLRGRYLQQFFRGSPAGYDSSATMRVHAPFVRSASPPGHGHIEEEELVLSHQALEPHDSASNSNPFENYESNPISQDRRDRAAQYWFTRAIGLGVEEQSALKSMQLYLSGERDDEVADLLRQQALEEQQDATEEEQRREDRTYRVLAEDTLRQESEQRKAAGKSTCRDSKQAQVATGIDSERSAATSHKDDSELIRKLTWEIEELKRKVSWLSRRYCADVDTTSISGDDSSTESLHMPNYRRHPHGHRSGESDAGHRGCDGSVGSLDMEHYERYPAAYAPAEGEAGPSNWLCAESEENDMNEWSQTGSGSAGRADFPHYDD